MALSLQQLQCSSNQSLTVTSRHQSHSIVLLLRYSQQNGLMFNRACRLMDKTSRSSSSGQQDTTETSTRPAAVAKYTESERLARWKSLFLKVSLIFTTIAAQTKAKLILGNEVYSKLFKTVADASTPEWKGAYRLCKGQFIGKPIPMGSGSKDQKKAHMDPTMCQHNSSDMMPRGNKTEKWWTCQKCMSRWERIPENKELHVTPMDEDRVTFGKHAGETYLHVYLQDPAYCDWVQRTVEETNPAPGPLTCLSQYIHMQGVRETHEADDWQDMDL